MRARERVAQLTRAFDEQHTDLFSHDPLRFDGYPEGLARARAETGLDDACIWGWADIEGTRCALVVFDFAFMGGSMGMVVGETVARAFDAARRARAPVVTVTASGGARMQEGMWSLVQMAKTIEAHTRHAAAGLAHVTLLTSPTTGGVYASFASLADVIYAEHQATVGFAGPRVVEHLTGTAPPGDVHTAEFALEHGLIDAIVGRDRQPVAIGTAVRSLTTRRQKAAPVEQKTGTPASGTQLAAWEAVVGVREPGRPKGPAVLDVVLSDGIDIHGDRSGASDDEHVVVRVGGLAGTDLNAVGIAQNATGDGRIRPEGFRKAIRALRLAGRLGLPVVTVIDTRGADPLEASEGTGVAAAIAQTFETMLDCPAPTVAVLTGEGGSGGALAMAVADRVVALGNSVFSVIAPEGAAAILYRDASRAPELAQRLRITVPDLVDLGLVDVVVPEPPGGVQANPQAAMKELAVTVASQVERLVGSRPRRRAIQRHRRWREIGAPSTGAP